ncbi:MAG: protein translocase subunit SecF [Candidatus Aenigmatarchaeota archaeon]
MGIREFYHNKWKPLMIITIIVSLLSAGFLVYNIIQTGSPVERDIELTGGKLISMSLDKSPDLNQLAAAMPEANFKIVTGLETTLLIETSADADETTLLNTLKELGVSGEYSVKTIGPSLGEVFWKQTQLAMITAFIIMAIVVFIIFRSPVPSLAVIFAGISDIMIAMVGMHFLNIQLSLATLAALLMLIGYSVDTDIVLTSEVLKRKEDSIEKRIENAMKTGVTMTACAIAALVTLYFVSGSHVLQQMSLVLIVGLAVDLPMTWFTNTGILRWHMQRKESQK